LWWALLAAVLLGALALRVPALWRQYHIDEAHHLLIALDGNGFGQLRRAIAEDSQPMLDYALRRWVWSAILPAGEMPWRLPSLAASLGGILAAGLLARRRLRTISPSVGIAGGVAAALWLATRPLDIYHAGQARHYALLGLASVLWASVFVLRDERLRPWLLTLASVFLTQMHFFAVPLVGAAMVFEWISALRARRRSDVVHLTAGGLVVIGLLVALDWESIRTFFDLPHFVSAMQQQTPASGPVATVGAALRLAWRWLGTLQRPAVLTLGWTALACAGARPAARRLWLSLGVLLVVFAAIRGSSGYFQERYFTPFIGVGFAILVLGIESLATLVRRAPQTGATVVLVGLVAWLVWWRPPVSLRFPPRNFSETYAQLDALRREGRPVFVLAEPAWRWRMPTLYWRFDGAPPAPPPLVVLRDFVTPADRHRALGEFLAAHPDGRVLWHRDHGCDDPPPYFGSEFSCSRIFPSGLDIAGIDALVASDRLLE
jgi:hypothetical protein